MSPSQITARIQVFLIGVASFWLSYWSFNNGWLVLWVVSLLFGACCLVAVFEDVK